MNSRGKEKENLENGALCWLWRRMVGQRESLTLLWFIAGSSAEHVSLPEVKTCV